jgi:hypothetical protein
MAEASKSLVWKGEALTAKMRAAQVAGVNATMGECVTDSRNTHEWQNRTGILEGGINIVQFAAADARGVSGTWGVQDVRYALIHELGGVIVPVKAKALAIPQPGGGVKLVQKVTIPARPYLRPSADRNYPKLADNIRKAFSSSGAQP